MKMDVEKAGTGGVGFLGLLFLLFLGLKLGGWIDWSWWWVFSPIWIPIALFVLGVGIVFLYLTLTAPKGKK